MGRKQKIPSEDFQKVAERMIAWFSEHQTNLQEDKKMPFLGKFIREELHSSTSAFKRYTEQSEILRDALETVKEIQKEILIEGGLSGIFNPTAFIFTAKNVTDMRDRNEVEHIVNPIPIFAAVVDIKKLTDGNVPIHDGDKKNLGAPKKD